MNKDTNQMTDSKEQTLREKILEQIVLSDDVSIAELRFFLVTPTLF